MTPLDALPEDVVEALRRAPSAPAMVEALYDHNPRLSAKELAEAATALGRPVSKATATAWRKVLAAGGRVAGGEAVLPEHDAPEAGTDLLASMQVRLTAAIDTNDAVGAGRWATAMQRVATIPGTSGALAEDPADWGALSELEFRLACALLDKVQRQPLTDEQAQDLEAATRALDPRDGPHPAMVPLPALTREDDSAIDRAPGRFTARMTLPPTAE
jgi:hypothetical protein